jgi:ATP-binding cassette subfamily C (CFTR/MRP) protein 4
MINLSFSLPSSSSSSLSLFGRHKNQPLPTDDGYRVGRHDVYWLATIVILITFISCIVGHHMDLRQRLVGARMRIACSAAIYRKSLRMSKRAVTQTSAGNVVNLLSNDVSRLDYGFIFVHFIWILPFQGI